MALPDNPPPLQWLPVFEAVARHLSVKAAAEELHVTPSAISQQLKALESYLGLTLLNRHSKGMTLTEAGSHYLPMVREMLDAHQRAHTLLKGRFGKRPLRINMDPLVANELIIPHLREFAAHNPDIDLRIETSMHNIDFGNDPADATIRCADHVGKDLHGKLIHRCFANVIIAPAAQQASPIAGVSDLASHAWITYTPAANEWDLLCAFLKMDKPDNQKTLRFDNILSAITAVEQGLGIMIGLFPLMNRLVDSGKLMTITKHSVMIPMSHHLVCRKYDKDREDIRLFYQWCKTIFARSHGEPAA